MTEKLITNNEFSEEGWEKEPDGWSLGAPMENGITLPNSVIALKDQEGGEALRLSLQTEPHVSATIDGIIIKRIYKFFGITWRVPVFRYILQKLFKRIDVKMKVDRQYQITYDCLTIHNTEQDERRSESN